MYGKMLDEMGGEEEEINIYVYAMPMYRVYEMYGCDMSIRMYVLLVGQNISVDSISSYHTHVRA